MSDEQVKLNRLVHAVDLAARVWVQEIHDAYAKGGTDFDGAALMEGHYGDAMDALRAALPAERSAAERLALAADRMAAADAVFGKAIKDGTDWKSADRAAADAYKEFTEALSAYRAAKPDSAGAAPPAAEPAPCGTCADLEWTKPNPKCPSCSPGGAS